MIHFFKIFQKYIMLYISYYNKLSMKIIYAEKNQARKFLNPLT